ncbi:hypothetical protein N7G274_006619 [Stereocaulon virgatum]|uniref:RING-type domain-containing protein n=1 Tax=Stereocaulon virgatum TaxID=373712 RepID=A0ABR4A473_9LECA
MAPSPMRQLEQILNKTRQPLLSDLDNDLKCHICHESFLSGDEPEVPTRLPCGHICGQSCILKWLSPLSNQGKNSCPMCRQTIIEDWNRGPEHDAREGAGGVQVQTPPTHSNGPISSPGAERTRGNFQRPSQFYERLRESTPEQLASLLGSTGINTEHERLPRARYITSRRARFRQGQDEMNRRLWIKFCEGVVRIVEGSGYLNTSERLPVARHALSIHSYEEFMRIRAEDPATHQRILRTFPGLHTELVVNHAIPSVDFTSFSEAERMWSPRTDFFACHASDWHVRLERHGHRISREYPLGQRMNEAVDDGAPSEAEASRARAEIGTTNNDTTSSRPGEAFIFRMNRQQWTAAIPSRRARIIAALASRIERAFASLGDEDAHVQVEVSLFPEVGVPLIHRRDE